MSYFEFKQFRIYHDKCAMKVGTDGVLLGAWAHTEDSKHILDIGTGTGLIALMLAQRCRAQITGIEIDLSAAEQAKENVNSSPFSQQIQIVTSDIRDFNTDILYDNIVSNPPFYTEDVLPPDANRATARNAHNLSMGILVGEAKKRLCHNGLLQVILPYSAASQFISICALHALSLVHRTDICTKKGKPFKRVMLCMINNIEATQPVRDVLTLSDDNNTRSAAYQSLTKDFYIR